MNPYLSPIPTKNGWPNRWNRAITVVPMRATTIAEKTQSRFIKVSRTYLDTNTSLLERKRAAIPGRSNLSFVMAGQTFVKVSGAA